MRQVAAVEVRAVRSRRSYTFALRVTRFWFWFAAANSIACAAIAQPRALAAFLASVSLSTVVLNGVQLSDALPRWDRALVEWEALVSVCAICHERTPAGFERMLLMWPVEGVFTGQSVEIPTCLECRGSAVALRP